MGAALYLIFFGIVLSSILAVSRTIRNRKNLSNMAGVMIAMTLGMSVGLTVGVMFGILYSGNFFIATVLGMAVGMIVGFLAGLPIGVMAVLDGLLSGLMGGMMGAMLGEMIKATHQNTIAKIMFILFLGIQLILFRMIRLEGGKPQIPCMIYWLLSLFLAFTLLYLNGLIQFL